MKSKIYLKIIKTKNEFKKISILILFSIFFYEMLLSTENKFIFLLSMTGLLVFSFFLIASEKNKSKSLKNKKADYVLVLMIVLSGMTFYFVELLTLTFKFTFDLHWFKEGNGIWEGLSKNSYFFYFFILLLAPIFEEFIFRKKMLALLSSSSIAFSGLIVSVAFTAFHRTNFTDVYVLIFLSSMELNYIYLKTGKLILCIIFHIVFNFSNIFWFKFLASNAPPYEKYIFDILIIVSGLIFLFLLNVHLRKLHLISDGKRRGKLLLSR